MPTARLLTLSCSGGGGVCPGAFQGHGTVLPSGGVCYPNMQWDLPPPPLWTDITDRCKNITLPQTSFVAVKRYVVKNSNWNQTEIGLVNNATMCMFWWKEQTFLSSVRSSKPRECRQQCLLNLGLGRRNVSRGNCKIKFCCMCGLSVSFVIIWKNRSSWTILKSQSYSSNAVVNIMQKEAVSFPPIWKLH